MTRSLLLLAAICLGLALQVRAETLADPEPGLRQELARHPDKLEARFQLARFLSWQKRFPEAAAEYSHLLRVQPENVDYLLGMAQVQLWRGAPEQSVPLLKKARQLAPKYELIWHTEIQARLASGDPTQLPRARRVRDKARVRFPQGDWRYSQLDPAPEGVVAVAPAIAPTPVRLAASPSAVPLAELSAASLSLPQSKTAWEAGFSSESLTRGQPSWRSRYVLGEWSTAERRSLSFGLRQTERYALSDREMNLGGMLPLRADMQLHMEAGLSDTHRVLPARYGQVDWLYQPAQGWALDTGFRRSLYDLGLTRVAHLTLDRYLGMERFGYTLYEGGPDGSGSSPSHRWQWAHYYGESDWLGLTLSRGRESENTGSTGFLSSEVRGVMLSGRHSFAAQWSLSWDAGRQKQGDYYSRSGVRLGLRHTY